MYVRESTGQSWNGVTRQAFDDIIVRLNPAHVDGVVLFQLIADGRLKMEAFPGKRASEVTGFTDEATIYER
jgi:hypothetical protein